MWNLFACGEQIMRAADCKNLAEKPEGVFRQAQSTPSGVLFHWYGWWTRTYRTGTVRWTVPAASSKTGCLLTVCLRQTGNRARPPAPNQYNPNQIFPVGNGFGLFVYFKRYEQEYFPNGAPIRPDSKPRGPRKKKTT